MLKAQKKISKREMKEDTLVTYMAKATKLYDTQKKNIGAAVLAVAVIALGAWWYSARQAKNNEEASAKLGTVYSYYDQNQYQIAIDGVPERKITGLKSIVDEFGGTDAGNLARFYLANAYFQLGNYDLALQHFDDFSAKQPYLASSRLAGIGACYEAKGDHEKAAENFEQAGLSYPKEVDAAAHLNNAAHNFMQSGKNDKAASLFKKIKKEYPTSQFARDADRYISKLAA